MGKFQIENKSCIQKKFLAKLTTMVTHDGTTLSFKEKVWSETGVEFLKRRSSSWQSSSWSPWLLVTIVSWHSKSLSSDRLPKFGDPIKVATGRLSKGRLYHMPLAWKVQPE